MRERMIDIVVSRPVLILSFVFIAQAFGFYNLSHGEDVPPVRPLTEFPSVIENWHTSQEGVIEPEVQKILRADDLLSRSYVDTINGGYANLFVAFFRSQRTGQTPHSPKNCLPGSGWVPALEDFLTIRMPGESQDRTVNRYLVQKGEEKSIVLYWYQSRDRIVASEYWAKIYVVIDALRYNRTDTALVRVVVPVEGNNIDAASATAVRFAQDFYRPLRKSLPS
jgi:EpsI family protein